MVKLFLQFDQRPVGTNHPSYLKDSKCIASSKQISSETKRSDNFRIITQLGTAQGRRDEQRTAVDDNGLISSTYYAKLHTQDLLFIQQVQDDQKQACSSAAEERFRWSGCYPSCSPPCPSRCTFARFFCTQP